MVFESESRQRSNQNRKYASTLWVTMVWNRLPSYIINANNLNIDNYLTNRQVKYDVDAPFIATNGRAGIEDLIVEAP